MINDTSLFKLAVGNFQAYPLWTQLKKKHTLMKDRYFLFEHRIFSLFFSPFSCWRVSRFVHLPFSLFLCVLAALSLPFSDKHISNNKRKQISVD